MIRLSSKLWDEVLSIKRYDYNMTDGAYNIKTVNLF